MSVQNQKMHLIITQHWSTVQTTYKLYKPHDDVIQLINIPLEQLYHKQWTSPFPCGWDWLASLLTALNKVLVFSMA